MRLGINREVVDRVGRLSPAASRINLHRVRSNRGAKPVEFGSGYRLHRRRVGRRHHTCSGHRTRPTDAEAVKALLQRSTGAMIAKDQKTFVACCDDYVDCYFLDGTLMKGKKRIATTLYEFFSRRPDDLTVKLDALPRSYRVLSPVIMMVDWPATIAGPDGKVKVNTLTTVRKTNGQWLITSYLESVPYAGRVGGETRARGIPDLSMATAATNTALDRACVPPRVDRTAQSAYRHGAAHRIDIPRWWIFQPARAGPTAPLRRTDDLVARRAYEGGEREWPCPESGDVVPRHRARALVLARPGRGPVGVRHRVGITSFNYVASPTDYLNQRDLVAGSRNSGPTSNNVYAGSPNAYYNHIRDNSNAFGGSYDYQTRRPESEARITRSARTIASVEPAKGVTSPRPVVPITSFFDRKCRRSKPADTTKDNRNNTDD